MAADGRPRFASNWEETSSHGDVTLHLILLLLAVAALVLAMVLQVEAETAVVVPWLNIPLPEMCYLRRTFGLACPGCGLTRSFISLAHGDVNTAFQYNPAGPLLFLVLACQIPYRSWQIARLRAGKKEWSPGSWSFLPLWLVLAVMLGQWIVRWF